MRQISRLSACATIPGDLLQSLLADTPSLARDLCAAIAVDTDDLFSAAVARAKHPISVRNVELPKTFEDSLRAAIASIPNKSTRSTTKSLAQWGRRAVQLALVQSGFYFAIADGLLDGIGGRHLAFDGNEEHEDPPTERAPEEAISSAEQQTAVDQAPEQDVPIDVAVTSAEDGYQPTAPLTDAISDMPSHSEAPAPHLFAGVEQTASASTVSLGQAAGPKCPDGESSEVSARLQGESDPPGDRSSNEQVVSPQPQVLGSALDRFRMPTSSVSQVHGTVYGDTSERNGTITSNNFVAHNDRGLFEFLQQGTGEQASFSVLDPYERGYDALPPSFLHIRDFCIQTLGTIFVEGSTRDNTSPVATTSTTIDRVDVIGIFSKLFDDLVDESFGRLFLQRNGAESDDISLTRLQELGTGRSDSLLSARIDKSEGFEASSLTNLLASNGSSSISELKGAARRSARLTANKPPPSPQWHNTVVAVLSQFGRSQVTVASVLGAAGSGKSTMMVEICEILTDQYVKKRDRHTLYHKYSFHCKIFDFSRPGEMNRLRYWIGQTRVPESEVKSGYKRVRFCIIDECTFFEPGGFELLSELDYVIFVGDPRQMGAVDNAHLIRQFVTLAGGSNQLLDIIHRRIHPMLFDALNELAYEGRFSLAQRPESFTRNPYQLTTCHDSKFCIAAAMLCMAFYNAAEVREVCIATQDRDIVDWMRALIDLDPRAYEPLTAKISIIPLARIQGLETDVLVINPAEIDKHSSAVAGTLKFLFVILGRVRQHLAIVQPLRTPVSSGDKPPLFSFLLHGLLGEMPEVQQ